MKPMIAACLIVKGTDDEAPLLDACLDSLKGHVDGIFIDVNAPEGTSHSEKVLSVAKYHGADVVTTKWEGNFVKARNDNFARVPDTFSHIIWLDSDDTITNPEKIRDVAAIMPKAVDGVYINYEYDHDEYGNVTVAHYVARLVRNNGSFIWKSSFSDGTVTVHETLNPVRDVGKVMNEEFVIVHHSSDDRRDESLRRNITLLEGMLKESGDVPDPRILFYLATHCLDAHLFARAKSLFERYLTLSGWAEERAEAWTYLGELYQRGQEPGNARGSFMRAIAENPKAPLAYVNLAELEMHEKLWDKATEWLLMAVKKKADRTATIARPLESSYRAYRGLAECYTNLGPKHYKTALKWLKKAQELRPFEPDMKRYEDMLSELMEVSGLTEASITLLNKLKSDGETTRIVNLVNALPAVLQDSPLVMAARNHYSTPKVWPAKSVVIICGWGPLGNWGPDSLDGGLGGSEEAVIRISTELRDLGYDVTIFGTPGEQAGDRDGVHWRHYWEFNRKDTFDVLINWRNPDFFIEPVNARKRYLWLHDVMEPEELTPERLANIDKIIFVSQYHRDLYPFIKEEQCFVSGNGITPEDFTKLDGTIKRDPHRVIYMSSHVRGLELIYNIWPVVVKAVPDAKLDVYYGWESYDTVNRENPERMSWKQKMVALEKSLPGIKDHGRIGHDQINKEIFASGVWAYPCPFPEVYCITAVKAQAGGAVPVACDFAALKETVKYGVTVPMKQRNEKFPLGQWNDKELDHFKDELIAMLKDTKRQDAIRPEMMKWARTMSWKNTAKGWIKEFEG
jgi:tetratricopeptide (TPR) repeat protein